MSLILGVLYMRRLPVCAIERINSNCVKTDVVVTEAADGSKVRDFQQVLLLAVVELWFLERNRRLFDAFLVFFWPSLCDEYWFKLDHVD